MPPLTVALVCDRKHWSIGQEALEQQIKYGQTEILFYTTSFQNVEFPARGRSNGQKHSWLQKEIRQMHSGKAYGKLLTIVTKGNSHIQHLFKLPHKHLNHNARRQTLNTSPFCLFVTGWSLFGPIHTPIF